MRKAAEISELRHRPGRSTARRSASVSAAFVCCLVFASCGATNGADTTSTTLPPRLDVVVTTPVLADFVNVVSAGKADVYNIVKPNIDPHSYAPTVADIAAMRTADLVIENGVGLEPWFAKAQRDAGVKSDVVVDTSFGVTLRTGSFGEAGNDPHIWHSPLNARTMVANIRMALAKADPDNAGLYAGQERAYDAQLEALDSSIRNSFSTLTDETIVTGHDAFGYYADEFGLNYLGVVYPAFDSAPEPTSAQTAALVALIKAQKAEAVFSEVTAGPAAAAVVASAAGVKLLNGENALYSDSLGLSTSSGGNYIDMERHNTDVIVAALH